MILWERGRPALVFIVDEHRSAIVGDKFYGFSTDRGHSEIVCRPPGVAWWCSNPRRTYQAEWN